MPLQLVKPDRKYLPSIYEAIAEYKANPSKFDTSAVKKIIAAAENDFAEYFTDIENAQKGIGLKPRYVPSTSYWLVDEDKYIGSFDLRHSLTPSLIQIGGHIAYEIRPSARRMGYASKGLALCLVKAKELNIQQALVTCNADNPASYGVMHNAMLKFGGYEDNPVKVDDIIEKRVWINTLNNTNNDYIGQIVKVKIDRPMGSKHPKHSFEYPVNYGYIPFTTSGDGEELDAYVLAVDEPLKEFIGCCIAVIHRTNDNDDKLIVVPKDVNLTDEDIEKSVAFQEKWFKHVLIRK